MQVLVTGATGFVGGAVSDYLARAGITVRAGTRQASARLSARTFSGGIHELGDLSGSTDWRTAVAGVDVVVHAAARVHVMRDHVADPMAEYRRVNTEATLALAEQAAQAGVRRMVFVSTVKVNGDQSTAEHPYFPDDNPRPSDPYAISKAEAEDRLRDFAACSGMELVIVRPAVVYGPGVRGNILRMFHWAARALPLPLASVENARSLIALPNLCSVLHACATHPAAAGHTFLVSDGAPVSTPQLFRLIAGAIGKPAMLCSVPTPWLRRAAGLLGRESYFDRLCGSLVVDSSKAARLLNWSPVVTPERCLRDTGRWFTHTFRTR